MKTRHFPFNHSDRHFKSRHSIRQDHIRLTVWVNIYALTNYVHADWGPGSPCLNTSVTAICVAYVFNKTIKHHHPTPQE